IFAGSDLQAMGLYEAARELGVRIPENLSVVGYDDLPVARWVGPPLTTVRQPLTEMAEATTRTALTLARGGKPANLRLALATDLLARGSPVWPNSPCTLLLRPSFPQRSSLRPRKGSGRSCTTPTADEGRRSSPEPRVRG